MKGGRQRENVCLRISFMYCLGILIENLQNISYIYAQYILVLSGRQNKQVIKLNCKAIRATERDGDGGELNYVEINIRTMHIYNLVCVCVCVFVCVSAIVCNVICGTAACYTHCKLTISFKLQTRQADKHVRNIGKWT